MNSETFYGILITVALSALIIPLLLGYTSVLFYYFPIIRPSMLPGHVSACSRRYWFRFIVMAFAFVGIAVGAWILCNAEAFWGFLVGACLILVLAILLRVPGRHGERFASLVARMEDRDSDLIAEDLETTVFDVMQ